MNRFDWFNLFCHVWKLCMAKIRKVPLFTTNYAAHRRSKTMKATSMVSITPRLVFILEKFSFFKNLLWKVFSFCLLHEIHRLMSMLHFERLIEHRILICQAGRLRNCFQMFFNYPPMEFRQ